MSLCQTLKEDVIARHEALFKYAPCGIMLIDIDGNIIELNPKVLEILGAVSSEEVKKFNLLSHPPLVELGISDLVRRGLCGETVIDEIPFVSVWDKSSVIRFTSVPILDDENEICFALVIMEDMSKYHYLKSELDTTNKLLNTVIDSIPSLIWMKDVEGRYVHSNKSFNEFNGFIEGGIIGKTDYELWSNKDADFYTETDKSTMEYKQPIEVVEKVTHPVYGERWFKTLKTCVYNEKDEIIGSVGISCDITKSYEQSQILSEAIETLTSTLDRNVYVK